MAVPALEGPGFSPRDVRNMTLASYSKMRTAYGAPAVVIAWPRGVPLDAAIAVDPESYLSPEKRFMFRWKQDGDDYGFVQTYPHGVHQAELEEARMVALYEEKRQEQAADDQRKIDSGAIVQCSECRLDTVAEFQRDDRWLCFYCNELAELRARKRQPKALVTGFG